MYENYKKVYELNIICQNLILLQPNYVLERNDSENGRRFFKKDRR